MKKLTNELLEKYKSFKDITDNKLDDVFSFVIETTVDRVLDYCNLELIDWPKQLNNTVVLMVDDFIDGKNINKSDDQINAEAIKSVKEGDVTVTRETVAERAKLMAGNQSLILNYRSTLNKYRKLRR